MKMIWFVYDVLIFECVIINIVWCFWLIFWNKYIRFLEVFELSVLVGLLVNNNLGCVINVWVIVICCFCFLDILDGYFLSKFLIFNCLFIFIKCFCIIFGCLFVSIRGIKILFLFDIVFNILKFWNINFIIFLWKCVMFLFFNWLSGNLFNFINFLVVWLKVVIKLSNVDLFEFDLFMIVINLFLLILRFIWFKVIVVFIFLL